jgi:hypothetical protein
VDRLEVFRGSFFLFLEFLFPGIHSGNPREVGIPGKAVTVSRVFKKQCNDESLSSKLDISTFLRTIGVVKRGADKLES